MAAELTHSKSGIETVILINILALHKFEGYIFPCFFIKKPCHCQQNRSFVKKKNGINLFVYVCYRSFRSSNVILFQAATFRGN